MTLGVFVRAYDRVPRGYGIAWRCLDAHGSRCYPVPLNWAMRWLRALWFVLAFPVADTWIERREFAAYQRGYADGSYRRDDVAYARGLAAGRDEILALVRAELGPRPETPA